MYCKPAGCLEVGNTVIAIQGRKDITCGVVRAVHKFQAEKAVRPNGVGKRDERKGSWQWLAARAYDETMEIVDGNTVTITIGIKTVTLPASAVVTVVAAPLASKMAA